MKRLSIYLRKVIILLIGIPIVILGIILVPLPGPGFLVIFVGLVVLSYEFEWAQKHRDTIEAKLKDMVEKARKSSSSNKD